MGIYVDLINPKVARGVSFLEMDDTANDRNWPFILHEVKSPKNFDSKGPALLDDNRYVTFNGTTVMRRDANYIITQSPHIEKLSQVRTDVIEKVSYVA